MFVDHQLYRRVPFQDVAKAGLKFGDEESQKDEKAEMEAAKEKFKPLLDYLKKEAGDKVREGEYIVRVTFVTIGYSRVSTVVISNRLVTSPCAIVADQHGYTANVERMMSECHILNTGPETC